MPRPKACVVYVGDLPSDVRTREIEDVFYKVNAAPFCPLFLGLPHTVIQEVANIDNYVCSLVAF